MNEQEMRDMLNKIEAHLAGLTEKDSDDSRKYLLREKRKLEAMLKAAH